jgi:hypothetical protein
MYSWYVFIRSCLPSSIFVLFTFWRLNENIFVQGKVPDQPHLHALAPRMPESPCACGQRYLSAGYRRLSDNCTVFLDNGDDPLLLPVYELDCPEQNAGCVKKYDGTNDGIFLRNVTQAVSLISLYKAVEFLHSAGMPPETFHRSLLSDYSGQYSILNTEVNRPTFLHANTWRLFLFVFLHCINEGVAQDAQRKAQDFKCIQCGDSPRCLIVDGTSITMKKEYFKALSITGTDGDADPWPVPSRAQRSFVNHAPTAAERRALIEEIKKFGSVLLLDCLDRYKLLVTSQPVVPGGQPEYPKLAALNEDEYGLVRFFGWIYMMARPNGTLTAAKRKNLGVFIAKNLATDTAVVAYMPWGVATAIKADLDNNDGVLQVETMKSTAKSAPILFKMLDAAGAHRAEEFDVPVDLRILLSELCERSLYCVDGLGIAAVDVLGLPPNLQPCPEASSRQALDAAILCGLPQIRRRPNFVADVQGSQSQRDEGESCHKNFRAGGAHTGGLMTVFCEHEVCYAAFVMENSESRNHLFSFMLKHLPELPKVIVYDFGCAALEYFLNRLPAWIKDTVVVVDKFHWENHNSCASAFNMRLYQDIRYINSQAAEQCNASLKLINRTLHKSSQPLFMAVLREYLRGRNENKNKNLQEVLDRSNRYLPV